MQPKLNETNFINFLWRTNQEWQCDTKINQWLLHNKTMHYYRWTEIGDQTFSISTNVNSSCVPFPLCTSWTNWSSPFVRWAIFFTWLAQLFKSYEMSNVTGWGGNDSSPHPPINIPLHHTRLSSMDAHWGTKIAGVPWYAFTSAHGTTLWLCKCVVNTRPYMAKLISLQPC